MKLSTYEKVFADTVKVYVKQYPEYSFQFYFDDRKHPVIGTSKKTITTRFKNSEYVFDRIFKEGSLGLGEEYAKGNIIVNDRKYKEVLMIFVRAAYDKKIQFSLSPINIARVMKARLAGPFLARESQKENINSHYSMTDWFKSDDDSNKFYLYWLNSRYIQYTCAKWDSNTKTLEEAQRNKFEFYRKRLGITKQSKGKTILDLGCGWGGLMFYLAENYGLKCSGMTLSTAQGKYINQEIKRRKLQNKVRVIIDNVHNLKGKYDYVVSVGLLEHIDDYDDLYKKTADALNPGGKALFHAMHNRSLIYKPDPFLLKYIFPGGAIPNIDKNIKIFKRHFKHVERNDLPDLSYPKTLDCWYDAFLKNEDKIRALFKKKGKVKDVDFAIRVFKHYLLLADCGLTADGLVSNILVYN